MLFIRKSLLFLAIFHALSELSSQLCLFYHLSTSRDPFNKENEARMERKTMK